MSFLEPRWSLRRAPSSPGCKTGPGTSRPRAHRGSPGPAAPIRSAWPSSGSKGEIGSPRGAAAARLLTVLGHVYVRTFGPGPHARAQLWDHGKGCRVGLGSLRPSPGPVSSGGEGKGHRGPEPRYRDVSRLGLRLTEAYGVGARSLRGPATGAPRAATGPHHAAPLGLGAEVRREPRSLLKGCSLCAAILLASRLVPQELATAGTGPPRRSRPPDQGRSLALELGAKLAV
ncbi:uncharacterized protein [Equus przewalskii]|uniref:Uncharacterized protein n=1 Tax=Equus przewalskii TaxID=9798 RepID=A0ABM4P564_EQUPR